MKHNSLSLRFILCVCLTSFFFSCKKNYIQDGNSENLIVAAKNVQNTKTEQRDAGTITCVPKVTALIAGQHMDAGTVTVWNDDNFVYVTYQTANGFTLKETHLFVGNCNAIPTTNNGNPIPGAFPYASTHSNATTFTYQIPIASINTCGCIAAHAAVVKLDAVGNVIDSQTAWGFGTRFVPQGNWATKFDYCLCFGTP